MKKLSIVALIAALIGVIAIVAKKVKDSYNDPVLDDDEDDYDEYDDFSDFINVNDEGSIDVEIHETIKEPTEDTETISD